MRFFPHWLQINIHVDVGASYPSPKDLVNRSALFQSALCDYLGPHFLHVQHESVERLLDVRLLILLFLGRNGRLPAGRKQYKDSVGDV